jgi:hypothetical protein
MNGPLRVSLAIFAVGMAACTGTAPNAAEPAPAGRYEAVLVDSVAWETEMSGGVAHRVEVRREGRAVATIPGVVTTVRPVWSPGQGVVGYSFDVETGGLDRAFRYDPARARITFSPVPDDFGAFTEPALSPDGRYVAYTAYDGQGRAWAVVRAFPDGRVAVRGPPIGVEAGDVAFNGAEWRSADAFEVMIDLGGAEQRWARVRGTVGAGVASVDTVTTPS